MRIRGWRDERGAAAVEFAIIAPLLILLLFGIVEYGFVFNAQLQVTGAAREAAREMAITSDAGQANAAALGATAGLAPALTAGDITYSTGTTCPAGQDVTATIGYDKPFLTGLFGATVHLSGTGTFRCQG
jgi:Flp pilus assembly protein TadG